MFYDDQRNSTFFSSLYGSLGNDQRGLVFSFLMVVCLRCCYNNIQAVLICHSSALDTSYKRTVFRVRLHYQPPLFPLELPGVPPEPPQAPALVPPTSLGLLAQSRTSQSEVPLAARPRPFLLPSPFGLFAFTMPAGHSWFLNSDPALLLLLSFTGLPGGAPQASLPLLLLLSFEVLLSPQAEPEFPFWSLLLPLLLLVSLLLLLSPQPPEFDFWSSGLSPHGEEEESLLLPSDVALGGGRFSRIT